MPKLREYLEDDGSSPYARWFDSLEPVAAAKVTTAKTKLELGHFGKLEPVGEGVFEYKIDYGPGYRLYLAHDGAKYILLLGGGDKRQQSSEIKSAKERWAKYKLRMARSMKKREEKQKAEGRPAEKRRK